MSARTDLSGGYQATGIPTGIYLRPARPRSIPITVSEPAWKAKPSWYLLTTEDKMIPPDAQRQMAKRAGATIVEVKGSHSIYVSQPQAVATLIEKAAKGALLVAAR